jgi:hypothetical protein
MGYTNILNKIKMSKIEVPEDYIEYDAEQKDEFINELVDNLLLLIDKNIPTGINRIEFLKDVLTSSLAGAVDTEHYEAAAIIRDIMKRLDE